MERVIILNKIEVTNTAIIINNYTMGDCPQLENKFKIYDPITHSYWYMGLEYDADNERLYLPRGIDLWFVKKMFWEEPHVIDCVRPRKFTDVYMRCLPRDDVQKEALRFMLGKQEYEKLKTHSQLSVNLSTGKGKTYITVAAIAYLSMTSIIITESVDWLKQWKKRFIEYTNITSKEICTISGSGNVFKLLSFSNDKISEYKVFLVTHDTLQYLGNNYGWEKVSELFIKLGIGVKVFDEAHLNFKNICLVDYYTNVYKTYYLTATPAKSSEHENKVYQLAFKNVSSIELFDEENDPHTHYVAMRFNSKPSPMQVSDCKNAYGLDRNKYVGYIFQQEEFYKICYIIMDIILKFTKTPEDKALIYIGTNAAIGIMYEWITNNYPELIDNVGIYTSIVSTEDKQKALTKRVILSTTKSAGAAVDIAGLKITVVLAEPFKSEVIARQSLGRTRADNTIYIELVDSAFRQCLKFYYYKLPIFEKYAKDCQIIKLTDDEINNRYMEILENRKQLLSQNKLPSAFEYIEFTNAFEYIN